MIVSVLLFSVTLFSGLAWATVTGSWDVTGTVKVKASIKKFGSGSEAGAFVDYFVFDPDTSFHMIDMDGTWSQKKTKYSVYLDSVDIATYLETSIEDALWSVGYDVDVTIVRVSKNSFTGKESKTGGTISGKYNLAVSFLISFFGGMPFAGKATAAATFSGTRALPVSPLGNGKAVQGYKSPDGMDALLRPLVDSITRSVLNPNADLPQ